VAYDAVFFDVGNTLIHPYPSVGRVCAEVLLAAGHDRRIEEIDALLPLVEDYYEDRYESDDTFWTSDEGAADVWVGMYSLLCRRLGLEESEAPVLARAVYDSFGSFTRWRAYPDVAPAFERLRSRGVIVGIISNWDTRLDGVLRGLGLGGLIDTVVCSAVEGLHKPDPRIFELACARAGVRADRSAHVGDHMYADVVGARGVGMKPVLIDRHGPADAVADDGVPRIATLDDLEEALSS
jgi:putative hydrolase of the HAD superfamily